MRCLVICPFPQRPYGWPCAVSDLGKGHVIISPMTFLQASRMAFCSLLRPFASWWTLQRAPSMKVSNAVSTPFRLGGIWGSASAVAEEKSPFQGAILQLLQPTWPLLPLLPLFFSFFAPAAFNLRRFFLHSYLPPSPSFLQLPSICGTPCASSICYSFGLQPSITTRNTAALEVLTLLPNFAPCLLQPRIATKRTVASKLPTTVKSKSLFGLQN